MLFTLPLVVSILCGFKCIFRMESSKKLMFLSSCSLQREMSQECIKIKIKGKKKPTLFLESECFLVSVFVVSI